MKTLKWLNQTLKQYKPTEMKKKQLMIKLKHKNQSIMKKKKTQIICNWHKQANETETQALVKGSLWGPRQFNLHMSIGRRQ